MSSPDFDLVVIGDCNPDVLVLGDDVTPAFGQQEKLVDRMSLEIGGSASITALGAMNSLTASDIPASILARARHVHVSSYFLLADALGPGLAGLFAAARSAGATTSLDTNWDPAERWRDERLSAAIAQADLLLPNEAEALALSGTSTVSAAALALTASGSRVAVKLGARGVLVGDGPGELHRVSLPPVTPVDTTGAGDCFNAGLIAGLLHGLPLPEAAALGCAAGALSTGALGGTAGAPDSQKAMDLAAHGVIELPAALRGEFRLPAGRTRRCARQPGRPATRSG